MEPIILLIISLIIGSLFKGKENEKPPAQKPNRAPRPELPKSPGNLKDLTRQLYGDLQKEIQKEAKEFRADPRPAEPRTERTEPVRKAGRSGEASSGAAGEPAKRSGRQEKTRERVAGTSPAPQKPVVPEPGSLLPETEEELARAIVFAEILGPPKAKRR